MRVLVNLMLVAQKDHYSYILLMPFHFLKRRQTVMAPFLNKLVKIRREIILFLAYCIDFLFSRELSFGGTFVKIRLVVFDYELINYN